MKELSMREQKQIIGGDEFVVWYTDRSGTSFFYNASVHENNVATKFVDVFSPFKWQ